MTAPPPPPPSGTPFGRPQHHPVPPQPLARPQPHGHLSGPGPDRGNPLARISPASWAIAPVLGVGGYVLALLLTLLLGFLLLLGLAQATGMDGAQQVVDTGAGQLDAPGEFGLGSLLVMITSMAFLGPVTLSIDSSLEMGGRIALVAPSLTVLAAVLALIFLVSRLDQRRTGSGVWGRLLLSVLTGATLCLLVVLVPTIVQVRSTFDEFGEMVRLTLHGISFRAALVAFLGGAGAALLGREQAAARRPGRLDDVLREIGHAAAVFARHLSALVVVGVVVLLILGLREGELGATLLIAGYVAGIAGVWALSVLHLGSVSADLSGLQEFGASDLPAVTHLNVFTPNAWAWSVAVLIAMVLVVLVSLRRAATLDRSTPLSWLWVPSVYLSAAALSLWAGRTSMSVAFSGAGESVHVSGSLMPAFWTIFIVTVVGLLVEVSARFVAPVVFGLLPAGLVRVLAGRPAEYSANSPGHTAPPPGQAAPPVAPGFAPAGPGFAPTGPGFAPTGPGYPPGGTVPAARGTVPPPPGSVPPPPPGTVSAPPPPPPSSSTAAGIQTRTLSPAARRRTLAGISIGAAVLLVVTGVSVTAAVLNTTTFSAGAAVEDYLSAVRDGDLERASALASPRADAAAGPLLTPEVYEATGSRVTDFRVLEEDVSEGAGTVSVSVVQGEHEQRIDVPVEREGRTALVLNDWRIAQPLVSTRNIVMPQSVSTITVNGVEVEVSGVPLAEEDPGSSDWYYAEGADAEPLQEVSLRVYPGTYEVELPSASSYEGFGPAQTLGFAVGDPIVFDASEAESVEFTAGFTQALVDDVLAEVDSHVDGCIAATSFAPPNCPNSASYMEGSDSNRSPTWSLTQRPALEVVQQADGAIYVETVESGQARLSYEYDDFSDGWEERTEDHTLTVSALVTVDGDDFELTYR